MMIPGRSSIAAFMACILLLFVTAPAYPSYNSEAGRKYSIACQRLADLRKSNKKKKYRSYWIDCIRTFELVEKKYPKSPVAGDACFDRAALHFELYRMNKYSRDLDESIQTFGSCQSSYPKHPKAPEALFRSIELSLDYKKNNATAIKNYTKLSQIYPDSNWTGYAKTRLGLRSGETSSTPVKKDLAGANAIAEEKGETGVVESIRHWSKDAYTRIVIDQTRPVKYQSHEVRNPDRLVFDIFNSRISPNLNKAPLSINDGILKQVRVSQYSPDTVRVVLDLASIKSFASFPLRDPDRLVIDITGEGGGPAGESTGTDTDTIAKNSDPLETETEQTSTVTTSDPRPESTEAGDISGKLTLSRQLGLKIKTIAIDAGHGGYDPGAIGKSGLKEKDITLDIAKRLAVLVRERLGCTVVMTRDRDIFIPLDQRPFIAKSHNADLFISIHVNANRKRTKKGIETYVQGLKASDREAMATAARENAMSTRSLSELDSEVDKMLKDLKIDNKIEESIQLAGTVQASLVDTMRPVQRDVVDHGVKSAFFYVLMNTNIPSILAEVGFISNSEEEKLLKNASYRQSIAEALFEGVKKYVNSRGPQIAGI